MCLEVERRSPFIKVPPCEAGKAGGGCFCSLVALDHRRSTGVALLCPFAGLGWLAGVGLCGVLSPCRFLLGRSFREAQYFLGSVPNWIFDDIFI